MKAAAETTAELVRRICESGMMLSVLLCLVVLPACEPPPDDGHAASSKLEESSPEPPPPNATTLDAGTPPASTLAPEEEEPVEPLASIDQRYLAAGDAETKLGLIGDISGLEGREAINAFHHLFQSERDTDLKVALLAAAIVQEECSPEQHALYASALWSQNPPMVRHMAVTGLQVLRTPEAIAYLQGLQFDPDADLRAAAVEALHGVLSQTLP